MDSKTDRWIGAVTAVAAVITTTTIVVKKEWNQKANCSVWVIILVYGYKLWIMTEDMRFWNYPLKWISSAGWQSIPKAGVSNSNIPCYGWF